MAKKIYISRCVTTVTQVHGRIHIVFTKRGRERGRAEERIKVSRLTGETFLSFRVQSSLLPNRFISLYILHQCSSATPIRQCSGTFGISLPARKSVLSNLPTTESHEVSSPASQVMEEPEISQPLAQSVSSKSAEDSTYPDIGALSMEDLKKMILIKAKWNDSKFKFPTRYYSIAPLPLSSVF